MERTARTYLATFFSADETLAAGSTLAMAEGVIRHMRALRLGVGASVRLIDGRGHRADGTIVRLSREIAAVEIDCVEHVSAGPTIHLLTPVADRDRMLWLAEKSTEIGVASWRPVFWRRSRGVKPRGEGSVFASRLRSRMIGALEQSAGAYLPAIYPEATVARAIAASPEGTRVLLLPLGRPILSVDFRQPVTVAVGPEGGMEPDEVQQFAGAGFEIASLGSSVLRFETAGIAALAVVQAAIVNEGLHADA